VAKENIDSEQREKNSQSSILVVEDDADIRSVISHALGVIGYNIREAEDGRVAMAECEKALPDLILTDIKMPHVDGREFVKWFRANYSEPFVPILLLTALTDIDSKVEGLELGADDYLTKPFHHRELRARIQALLRIKHLTNLLTARTKELQSAQAILVAQERKLVAAQMAGAAAHNLGQPVTTILLHCRLLEKSLGEIKDGDDSVTSVVHSIQKECSVIKEILDHLSDVNPDNTESYIDGERILSLDPKNSS